MNVEETPSSLSESNLMSLYSDKPKETNRNSRFKEKKKILDNFLRKHSYRDFYTSVFYSMGPVRDSLISCRTIVIIN